MQVTGPRPSYIQQGLSPVFAELILKRMNHQNSLLNGGAFS